MDCDHMLQLIHHYMDGNLSQWRYRAVSRHMDECPPCAQHVQINVQFRQVVATKCTEEVPHNLRLRISEALGSLPTDGPPLDNSGGRDFLR